MTLYTLTGKEAGPGDLAVCGCQGDRGAGRCWIQPDGRHLDADACRCLYRPSPGCPVDAHRSLKCEVGAARAIPNFVGRRKGVTPRIRG